jgi:transposase
MKFQIMNSELLFSMALGLQHPWRLQSVEFKTVDNKKELHITIDFEKGSKFYDDHGHSYGVYDSREKTWRHLNFFEHHCYLHCKVPRVTNSQGKVTLVSVPWAREGSGFTLLFESFVMLLIESEMPVNKAAVLLGENAHRLWTIFNYWMELAYVNDKPSQITKLGVDETSAKQGHEYITVGVDLREKKVVHVTEGKGKEAVKALKTHFIHKGMDIDQVAHASIDLSPAYIAGISDHFPQAEIHFDRFHVVKLLNEAMNKVRQLERKEHDELKGHKYTFLKNRAKLSDEKAQALSDLITLYPTLGTAYRLKELFNDLWEMETEEQATDFLVEWCKEVDESKIEPFKQFSKTVKVHWQGIINFCETEINNGILEGINSKIQLAKRRARGFRQIKNFINMIYLLCGKLKFDFPNYPLKTT